MPPLRTPGPTGHTDAHDPNIPGQQGDSPGPLGNNDYALAAAQSPAQWLGKRLSSPLRRVEPIELDLSKLKEQLIKHEGFSLKAFKTDLGVLKIGIGFKLERPDAKKRIEDLKLDFAQVKSGKVELTEAEVRQLYNADVAQAVLDCRALVKTFATLPEVKKRVLIDMMFILGTAGFAKLSKMISALEVEAFDLAAREMRHSGWYRDAGERGKELAALMEGHSTRTKMVKAKSPQFQTKSPPPHAIQLLGLRGLRGRGKR
jgi:GH24 family phage-related lysozyme (muramidase)